MAGVTAGAPSPGSVIPPVRLVAASGTDLVPVVSDDGPALTGRPASSTVVVVNSGGTRATGRIELKLLTGGLQPASAAGLGWACPAGTGRCTAAVDLPPGTSSPAVRVVQDVRADQKQSTSVTAQLTTELAQPTANDIAASDREPVRDSTVDLGVVARPRGPVRSGDEALFDVDVVNLGSAGRDAGATVVVRDRSSALGSVRGSGSGWSCTTGSDGLSCAHPGPLPSGGSLPRLEVARRGPEHSTDRSNAAVGISAVLDTVDAYPHNDFATGTTSVVPATGGDLLLAVSADPLGGFVVGVSEAGRGTSDPIEVGLSEADGGVTAVSGAGWSCGTGAAPTCRHPGPVAADSSLPELRVTTSGKGPVHQLEARLADPSFPGSPETVRGRVVAPLVGPAVAIEQARGGPAGGTASAVVRARGAGEPLLLRLFARAASYDSAHTRTTASGSGWSCSSDLVCRHPGGVADLPALTLSTLLPERDVEPVEWSAESVDSDGAVVAGAIGGASGARPPVDLVLLTTAGDPAYNASTETTLEVLNAGRSPSEGSVLVAIDSPGRGRVGGAGWTCEQDNTHSRCSTQASVPAGGRLPSLILTQSGLLRDAAVPVITVRMSGSGVGRSGGATAEAVTPFGSPRQSVSVTLTPEEPLAAGRVAASTATVRNDGAEPAPGPAVVQLDSPRGAGTASGSGWTCESWGRCTHAGPIGAGAALPALLLNVGLPVGEPLGTGIVQARVTLPSTPSGERESGAAVRLPVVDKTGPATLLAEVGGPANGRVAAGATSAFSVRVSNPSSADVAAPTVRLTPSQGLQLQIGQPAGWVCSATTCQASRPLVPGDRLDLPLSGTVDPQSPAKVSLLADVTADSVRTAGSGSWLVPGRGVDLLPVVNAEGAVAPGGVARFAVEVVNAGGEAATAPTEVHLRPGTLPLQERLQASGGGWSCALEVCRHDGPVSSGGRLPSLSVSVPVNTGTGGRAFELAALVRSADDAEPSNDSGRGQLRIVTDAVDLSPQVRLSAPVTPGADATYDVVLHNVGTVRHDAQVVLDARTLGDYSPTIPTAASGTGWTCLLPLSCRYDAPLEAGQQSAPLRLTGDATFQTAGLHVRLSSPQDLRVGNDAASVTVPAGRGQPLDVAARPGPAPGTAVVAVASRELSLPGPVGLRLSPAPLRAAGHGWSCTPAREAWECTQPGELPPRTRLPELTVEPVPDANSLQVWPLPATFFRTPVELVLPPRDRGSRTGPVLTADVQIDSPDGGRTGRASYVVRNVGNADAHTPITVSVVSDTLDEPVVLAGTGWACTTENSLSSCSTSAPVPAGAELPPLTARTRPDADPTPRRHGFRASFSESSGEQLFVGGTATGSVLGLHDPADLLASVTPPAPVVGGAAAAFSVQVDNAGGRASDGDVVLQLLAEEESPGHLPYNPLVEKRALTASGTGWSCDTAGTCRRSALAPDASAPPLQVLVPTSSTGASPLSSAVAVSARVLSKPGGPVTGARAGLVRLRTDPIPLLTAEGPLIAGQSRALRADVVAGSGSGSVARVDASWSVHWPSRGSGTGWTCTSPGRCSYAGPLRAGQRLPTLRLDVDVPADVSPYSLPVSLTVSAPDQASYGDDTVTGEIPVARTPAATTLPSAPAAVRAVAGDSSARVSWTAAAGNGSPVTGYTATSSPGGRTCSTSGTTGCTVTGLTNGTSYTFRVSATSSAGTGPASAPSNGVTPTAVASCEPSDWVQGAIRQRYISLNSQCGFLGQPLTRQLSTPGGTGMYNHFQGGSIHWTAGTGAWETHGGIRETWGRLGWETSPLRFPITNETPTPFRRGAFNHFQGGSIYWSPATGAREVRGGIRATWAALGWENSAVGFPLTDELRTPYKFGAFNHFERGSIYWSPATQAREVRGAIRDKWAALGWENGFLGFPLTNETPTPSRPGAVNVFQGGSIYWAPGVGAHVVHGAILARWGQVGWENSTLGFPVTDEYAVPGGRRSDFQHGSITWTPAAGAVIEHR